MAAAVACHRAPRRRGLDGKTALESDPTLPKFFIDMCEINISKFWPSCGFHIREQTTFRRSGRVGETNSPGIPVIPRAAARGRRREGEQRMEGEQEVGTRKDVLERRNNRAKKKRSSREVEERRSVGAEAANETELGSSFLRWLRWLRWLLAGKCQ